MSVIEGVVLIAVVLSSIAFLVVTLGAVLFVAVLGLFSLSGSEDGEPNG